MHAEILFLIIRIEEELCGQSCMMLYLKYAYYADYIKWNRKFYESYNNSNCSNKTT